MAQGQEKIKKIKDDKNIVQEGQFMIDHWMFFYA